jgi:actin-related protein
MERWLPALFVAPTHASPPSRTVMTALVVDIGASGCRVTPVVDGLVLGSPGTTTEDWAQGRLAGECSMEGSTGRR